MDEEKIEKLYSKIAKLLNLADPEKNGNEQERTLAAEKAAAIMREYDLDEAKICMKDGKFDDSAIGESMFEGHSTYCKWKTNLRQGLCTIFNCYSYVHTEKYNGKIVKWSFSIIGTKNDTQLLVHFFDRLWKWIETSSYIPHKDPVTNQTVSFKNAPDREAFCYAFTEKVLSRLNEMYALKTQHASKESTNAIVLKTNAIDRFKTLNNLNKLKKITAPNQAKNSVNVSAFRCGDSAGANYSLSQPIASANGSGVQHITVGKKALT